MSPGRSIRSLIAAILAIAVVALTPATVIARYINSEITDTDAYVATVAPLGKNPLIQKAVAKRATKEILALLPTGNLLSDTLQPVLGDDLNPLVSRSLDSLGAVLSHEAEQFVTDAVNDVVKSDEFAEAWVTANRRAHDQLVALLTGQDTEKVQTTDGTVSVNLGAVIAATRELLMEKGYRAAALIPEVSVEFKIIHSKNLDDAQRTVRILDRSASWLPYLLAGLLLLALAVSTSRRQLLGRTAIGVALSMLLVGGLLMWVRSSYLGDLPVNPSAVPAIREVFDTLMHPLHVAVRWVFGGSLLVALGAWLIRRRGA